MHASTPGTTFDWDPTSRLVEAHVRNTRETTMAEREAVARRLREDLGPGPLDVLVVCDGPGLTLLPPMLFWGGVFRLGRGAVRIALVGFPEDQARQLRAWAAEQRFQLRECADEATARAWLASRAPP